jgi:hypothetical protein
MVYDGSRVKNFALPEGAALPSETKESQMGLHKWQALAFVGLSVALFFSWRYVSGYFSQPAAVELMVVSITTFVLSIGMGIAVTSALAPRIEEYRTRPKNAK